jgi:hypothetical protein
MINRPPVQSIEFTSTEGNPCQYTVGRNGVTRIPETEENGEYSFVNWVEVWADEVLLARFPQNKLDCIRY